MWAPGNRAFMWLPGSLRVLSAAEGHDVHCLGLVLWDMDAGERSEGKSGLLGVGGLKQRGLAGLRS